MGLASPSPLHLPALRTALDAAQKSGADLDAILARMGKRRSDLEDGTLLPRAVWRALWEECMNASGDVDYGLHHAESAPAEHYDIVGLTAARQATAGAAIEVAVRYSRLLPDAAELRLEQAGEHALLRLSCDDEVDSESVFERQTSEATAATFVVLGRSFTGQHFRVARATFRHSAPRSVREHRRIFGDDIEFNAPATTLLFSRPTLELPLLTADPAISRYLVEYANEQLSRLEPTSGLNSSVKAQILVRLGSGAPEIHDVARALAMSHRTLQRRLEEQGTSFRALVDDTRRRACDRYLRDRGLTFGDIADLLGFSDVSNFYRAFRRWHEDSPAVVRRRLLGAG